MADQRSDDATGSFWYELKRRKVFRVATAYCIAAFVLLQILDATAEALGLTTARLQILLATMIIGFPVTVALAWFLEITPQGLIAEPSGRLSRRFGRASEIALLAVLFLLAGLLASFIVTNAMRLVGSPDVRVAVLAFENFTGDPDNAYISDGLAEELIAGLAGLDTSLVVLPRMATFYYQDKDVDWQTVAEALQADMLVEGSLLDRRGNRLRVAAQLIDTRTGGHIWSNVYDRELQDLIQVKQDITSEVVSALQLALAPGTPDAVAAPATGNGEAYDLYLQGKDLLQRGISRTDREVARDLFTRAYELDPGFAEALAGRCRAEISLYTLSTAPDDYRAALTTCSRVATVADQSPESRLALADLVRTAGDCRGAEQIYRQVIDEEPELEAAYYGLARCQETLGDIAAAEQTYLRSIELERRNWQTYLGYSAFLYGQGRYLESADMSRRIIELTPDNGPAWSNLGTALFAADRWEDAGDAWRRGHELTPNQYSYVNLATALYYQRRFAESAELLEMAAQIYPDNYRVWGKLGTAYRNLPGTEEKSTLAYLRGVRLAEAAIAADPDDVSVLGPLSTYYANVGRFAEAEETLEHALALAPENPELHYFQALVQRLQAHDEAAEEALAKAVRLGYSRRLIAQEPLTEKLASVL